MSTPPNFLAGPRGPILDLMRLAAAGTVFWSHVVDRFDSAAIHRPDLPGNWAHAAVVVFFVLSGYVVAGSQRARHSQAGDYVRARLTRLCSIVLPAIALTVLVDVLVAWLDPVLHAEYARPQASMRYLLTAGFLNESWWLSAAPQINVPLWSLSFEFFYYAIYGLWAFKPAGRAGWLWPVLGCLVAGPKILILMPIWLAGVVVCRMERPALGVQASWLLSGSAALVALALIALVPPFPGYIGGAPWFFAAQFGTDWLVGIAIALAVWLIPAADPSAATKPVTRPGAKVLRKAGDLTFSLYVVHYPLLILYRALTAGWALKPAANMALGAVVVLTACVTIGLWLEARRPFWLMMFDRIAGVAGALRCWHGRKDAKA